MAGKRQHYVPQFLLKSFAAGGKGGRVWVYDKRTGDSRLQSIKKVAFENRFYDIPVPAGVALPTEQELARMEADAAPALAKVVTKMTLQGISPDEKYNLALALACQLVRGPAYRWYVHSVLVDEFGGKSSSTAIRSEPLRALWRESLPMADVLYEKLWTLRVPPQRAHYLISDQPVVLNVSSVRRDLSPAQQAERAVVTAPLSPSVALILFPPHALVDMLGAEEWLDSGTRIVKERQPAPLEEYRAFIACQVLLSFRWLFSSSNDFSLVEEVLAMNPAARDRPLRADEKINWPS